MKTILYVDGFNLYYSAVKDTPLKWLNPIAPSARLFPRNQIVGVNYFKESVGPMPRGFNQYNREHVRWHPCLCENL